jgi:hypothetical protein
VATLLNELIARYGEAGVLSVRPYVLESGETARWLVEIDGEDVPDADVRITEDPEGPEGFEFVLMFLVRGDEEIEIGRWSRKRYPHGPSAILRTLGDLR